MNYYYDHYDELTCDTTIKEVKDGYYTFEETIFYGEKGGMPSDKGTINGLEVVDLKWEGETLYHKVDGTLENPIHMEVEKEKRYYQSAVQSALHLLDGYYETKGLYLPSVGVNPDNQWFEVNTKEVSEEDLKEVEEFMNEVIHKEIPCTITYMKGSDYHDEFYQKFDELRLVQFGEINTQPCGTLHVSHTGQIESFVILDHEKTAKGTRVYFTCHHITNQTLKSLYANIKEAAKVAGVKKEELCDRVSELSKNVKQYKKELADVKKELIAYKAQSLLESEESIIHYETQNANDVRAIAQAIMNQISGNKVIVSKVNDEINFAIISSESKARDILETIKASFEVVGGGSPKIVTAKANTSLEAFEEVVTKAFI